MANEGWMSDIHEADAIFVSTHSQGSIVSTHLLHRLIQDNHITTSRNNDSIMSFGTGAETFPFAMGMPETISSLKEKEQLEGTTGMLYALRDPSRAFEVFELEHFQS